jgi:PAS domain S-box-containing protein
MLCTLDTKRCVVYANQAFCKFAGAPERKLKGNRACGVLNCINSFDDPRGCGFGPKCFECKLSLAIGDTIKTGRKHRNVEYRATLKRHGFLQPIVALGSTTRITAGGKFRILLCLQDITEWMHSEQALQESEARLRAIFEHSMAGILLAAPNGRVIDANPAACRMLGRDKANIRRVRRFGIFDMQDLRVGGLLRERSRKGYSMGEITFIRADGTRFPAQIASALFETTEGLRTSMVFLDVSERKLAEESIHRFSRKLLSVREEEKRKISTILHHDVGSAVVGVTARLNAAEDDLLKGRNKEALESLQECRKVFMQSIKNLKTLAVDLRPPDLDLLGLRAALRQYCTRTARDLSLKIRFTDATGSNEISLAKQTYLFYATQECINNVIRHARAHHVRVRLSSARQKIMLSIADDGSGFDPSSLPAIPESHIGIRSMQEMAAELNGSFDITSNPQRGTKVTLTLPGEGMSEKQKHN